MMSSAKYTHTHLPSPSPVVNLKLSLLQQQPFCQWLILTDWSLHFVPFWSLLRHFCFGINFHSQLQLSPMLSFAFKIAINATSCLKCSPGVQKEGQFPALHHHQKKIPTQLFWSFISSNKTISSLHINLISSILFETKELSFTSFFFSVVGTWVCGGGGEGFVVVTSCCKR